MTGVTPGADPAELIPGDPDGVDRVAARLARVAGSASDAAGKLHTLDTDVWTGEASELYRAAIGDLPDRLNRAAEAFGIAAQALAGLCAGAAGRAVGRGRRRPDGRAFHARDGRRRPAVGRRAAGPRDRRRRRGRPARRRAAGRGPGRRAGAAARRCRPRAARVDTEHHLGDPNGFVSTPDGWGDSVADMRYTSTHDVHFAGALGGEAGQPTSGADGWQEWATSGSGRDIGVIEAGTVAAAGAALAAVTVIGRRRDRTALSLVGLDEDELRRRRDELGGGRRHPRRRARSGSCRPARDVRNLAHAACSGGPSAGYGPALDRHRGRSAGARQRARRRLGVDRP